MTRKDLLYIDYRSVAQLVVHTACCTSITNPQQIEASGVWVYAQGSGAPWPIGLATQHQLGLQSFPVNPVMLRARRATRLFWVQG